jgi:N-methylhydantoinase A/oxoprolinase/acetone carboxylase beta subunit
LAVQAQGRRLALSFDVGGTFTDFVVVDLDQGEVVRRHKVLTNARYPARGVLRGWRELAGAAEVDPEHVALAVHSTTLVTNSIIERKGARTALLTTKGFRDILELGREQMYDIYDLFAPPPEPLIPRSLRLEIGERTTASGEVLVAPDRDEVERAIETLRALQVEALAIAFLHAYRNPSNEQLVAKAIREALPELAVSLSSDVAPIAGEYERASTVAADAFAKPSVASYVGELRDALKASGMHSDLHLMMSSGEIASAETAVQRPIRLLESGPASGAIAAAFFGRIAGHQDVLSLDMGGTTAKACVIEGGKPEMAHLAEAARVRRFMRGSGLPIVSPVVDLIEIGAGGGSIARRDELGLLKVGPDSAGADPGPACYGLGGELSTVSDANLALGYLNPDYFLGGDIKLDADGARAALGGLGRELGLDVEQTAWGIHRVVNENMAAAARVHIIERNRDPRSLAIIAFGGAGPAHAVAVARILGSPAVIFPPGAGVASALGALVAPIAFTVGRTYLTRLDGADWIALRDVYRDLEREAVDELASAGVDPDEITTRRWAEMRLEGQYHEIEVPLPVEELEEAAVPAIRAAFEDAYRRRYGRMLEGLSIEGLQWRLTATGPERAVQLRRQPVAAADASIARKGARRVFFGDAGFVETPVFDREQLRAGMRFDGPAIVEERESTCVIHPGDRVVVDEYLSLLVELGGRHADR